MTPEILMIYREYEKEQNRLFRLEGGDPRRLRLDPCAYRAACRHISQFRHAMEALRRICRDFHMGYSWRNRLMWIWREIRAGVEDALKRGGLQKSRGWFASKLLTW